MSKLKEYSEKIWTNNEGKIDGYVFKGKRSFSKALIGLKDTFQKGQVQEIGKVKYKALDRRLQGEGLVIDVEIDSNRNRGIAVLKIYGPKEDIKKENSVTISKSKESDSKFIVLLAEKVIKPLINQFLSKDGEVFSVKSDKNQEKADIEPRQFTCSFCEKAYKTTQGLKNHITKMHLDDQSIGERHEELGTEHN